MDSGNNIDLNYINFFNASHTINDSIDGRQIHYIGEYIDYVFLTRSIIFNKILSGEHMRGRLVSVYNRDDVLKDIEDDQLIRYVEECTKASELIYFNSYLSSKNQTIFKEVSEMVAYFRRIRHNEEFELTLEQNFTMANYQFHEQVSMFNYLYSTFDKVSNIFVTIAEKISKPRNFNSESKDPERVGTKIIELASLLCKGEIEEKFLKRWVEMLQKSSILTLIRFKRNALSHDYSQINDRYNLSVFINTLYIIILRLLTVLRRCVYNDETLAEKAK